MDRVGWGQIIENLLHFFSLRLLELYFLIYHPSGTLSGQSIHFSPALRDLRRNLNYEIDAFYDHMKPQDWSLWHNKHSTVSANLEDKIRSKLCRSAIFPRHPTYLFRQKLSQYFVMQMKWKLFKLQHRITMLLLVFLEATQLLRLQ